MRDGFGSMALALATTLFYGVPLAVFTAFGTGAMSPPVAIDEGGDDPEAISLVGWSSVPVETAALEPPSDEPIDDDAPEAVDPPVAEVIGADGGSSDEDGGEAEGPADDGGAKHTAGAGGAGDGAGAPPPKTAKPSRSGKAQKKCTDPHPHVRVGRDGVVEIDRSLVDEYTKNLESFMSLGYSKPYDDDGLKGWYIGGFSCTSPVNKAGFRRGDVLLSVNGKNTRSWVGVYLLYQKLKNRSDFEVELVRKGEPVKLHFRVVSG
ncbi:MAG: hypothetical protein ABMB14_03405 [Myxococcota bacterium]